MWPARFRIVVLPSNSKKRPKEYVAQILTGLCQLMEEWHVDAYIEMVALTLFCAIVVSLVKQTTLLHIYYLTQESSLPVHIWNPPIFHPSRNKNAISPSLEAS